MAEELRPCPFCGEKPVLRQLEKDGWEILHRCGLVTVSVVNWSEKRVATSWNRRLIPEEAKLSELVPTNWLDPLLTGPDAVLLEVGKEVTLEHVAELLRRLKKRLQDAESRGNG